VRAQADLSPGDVLYIPPFWFHRVMATSDDSISVNMWSTSKVRCPV
jgi:ribosomal protein L16 Arg81 hydroxylase